MSDPAVIPAASLILMRTDMAFPEILMIERGRTMSFAPGALAFPGGRVDDADRAVALARGDPDAEDAAARIAALRETGEETGIMLGDGGGGASAMLIPYARWCPPPGVAHARFDTRFYLAPADAAHATRADGFETHRAFWAGARDVLAAVAAGDATMLFPTRCLLERLTGHADFADARAAALACPPVLIQPRVERRDDGLWTVIPDGLGYPYRAERIDDAGAR